MYSDERYTQFLLIFLLFDSISETSKFLKIFDICSSVILHQEVAGGSHLNFKSRQNNGEDNRVIKWTVLCFASDTL